MNQKSQPASIKILGGGIGNYPIRLELVPKRLIVNVYQQDLPGKGSQIPCWIFLTQGFSALKQHEIVPRSSLTTTTTASVSSVIPTAARCRDPNC